MNAYLAALTAIAAAADAVKKLPDTSTNRTHALMDLAAAWSNISNNVANEFTKFAPENGGVAALTAYEKGLILDGQFVEAVKSVRSNCGVGLKEAKDACAEFRDKNMTYNPTTFKWEENPPF